MTNQTCISCGMPIRTGAEAAANDSNKPYCHLCSSDDGTMKSYDEVLAGMTQFMVKTQGLDEGAASKLATEMMSDLPAWAEK